MNAHTIDIIQRSTASSLDGSIAFPQVVQMLLDVGVSRYHVDFERAEKTVYLRNGETLVEPLPMPSEPIAPDFNASEIAAAVRASQTEGQSFPAFLARARRAGCVGYTAYLDGRRVIYGGRLGDEHVERMP